MAERTIQDRLREEYFDLLPEIALVADEMKARVQFHTLEIAQSLQKHEYLIVRHRIKDCQSAITALEKRVVAADPSRENPGKPDRLSTFDPDTPDAYSLTSLHDLAGVRVLAFPPRRLTQIDDELRRHFPGWTSDPFKGIGGQTAFNYYGLCPKSSARVPGEYQIVSALVGLFWDVEHAALYKQDPSLKRLEPLMRQQTENVYNALQAFEDAFEQQLQAVDSDER